MTAYLLGIDIGTTATKAILLHPQDGIVAEASTAATLVSRQPGWAEEDPDQWWQNVATLCRTCLADAGVESRAVTGIGVSGMVPTLILVDAAGAVLRPSIQQNDARSHAEIQEFKTHVDAEDVLRRTGSAITQQSIGPKLLWLRRHEPDVMARATHVMGSYDYIVYQLTGHFSLERNWALESGLFDLYAQDWIDELLAVSSVDRTWFGPVHWPAEVVGEVSREAASHTGLAVGTPVVAGSADHIASAFSAGLKQPGDLLVKLGGAGDILYSLDQPVIDPRLFLDYHVIPGKYLLNGCMAASGSIIRWFHQQFAPNMDYAALDAAARQITPGSDGLVLLPYFLGEKTPIHDPLARGVYFGLTLSHSRAHLFRAVLEGIAYGFQHHLAVLSDLGLTADRARVTNGGSRSTLWRQITADVLGLPLEPIAHHPGSSLGAAFAAGKGIGLFHDWAEIERFIQLGEVTEPDRVAHSHYQELFAIYRALYPALQAQYARLAVVEARGTASNRAIGQESS